MLHAENNFIRSIELDANYAPAHEGLARVLLEKGQLHEAALHVNRALQLDSGWLPAQLLKGRIELQRGNYEKAVSLLRQTIAKSKTAKATGNRKEMMASALYWIGVARFRQGNWAEAERVFAAYLRIDPSNGSAKEYWQQAAENRKLLEDKPEWIRELTLKPEITRGQLALLLYNTLLPMLKKNNADSALFGSGFANNDSLIVCELNKFNLMPLYPDSTFKAGKKAVRGDLALALGQVLNGGETKTASVQPMVFDDVARVFPFYAYVNRLVALQIMLPVNEHVFGTHRPLNGLEALRAIEKTKLIVRKR